MKDIFSFFHKPKSTHLRSLSIALFSDETIRERSFGRVVKPETINYRTFEPEPGGLFCARIFGPVNDYECICGKYKRMKHRGMVCEVCGVEVIQSRVRRERMGHIELPAPVIHPWGFEALADILRRPVSDVRRIAYDQLSIDAAEPEIDQACGQRALKEAAGEAGAHLFSTLWPVLAPDLRPLIPLSGGRFATSDLNDLYRRVINRANRMARLIELNAPIIIVRNEHRQLQEAIDSLVQNGMRGKRIKGPNKRPLMSLFDLVASPRGPLRAGGGKRVDFSGAAIVVPHDLPRDTILLPRELALEVFKPWLYGRLEALGYTTTIKSAKRLVEKRSSEVLANLEIGVREHPVIVMKDARVGGFSIRLWDELAIGMSPDAMRAMGVTDAGDVVSVHVPASAPAVRETRALGIGIEGTADEATRGWLGKAMSSSEAELPDVLFGAALRSETDVLEDANARRLLGLLGNPDADSSGANVESWSAPAPPRPAPDPSALNPTLFRRVDELELSVRTANCLQNANIQWIGELVQRTEAELLKTKNFARKSLREVKAILADLGLTLGMRVPEWREQLAAFQGDDDSSMPTRAPARLERSQPDSSEPQGYDDDFEDFD